MSTCKDIYQFIHDYIADTLEPDVRTHLEKHLLHCPSCVNFIRTLEATPNVTRTFLERKMPEAMKASLHEFLRSQLKHGDNDAESSHKHS